MIVGLAGRAGAGKTTAAQHLVQHHHYTRRSFAAPIKTALVALDPVIKIETRDEYDAPMYGYINLASICDGYPGGIEDAKAIPDVRRLLQRMGTEVGRNLFGHDFWIDRAFDGLNKWEPTVFDDVRFDNEAQAIRDKGGIVLLVVRSETVTDHTHASEAGISGHLIDAQVINNGTVDSFMQRLERTITAVRA